MMTMILVRALTFGRSWLCSVPEYTKLPFLLPSLCFSILSNGGDGDVGTELYLQID